MKAQSNIDDIIHFGLFAWVLLSVGAGLIIFCLGAAHTIVYMSLTGNPIMTYANGISTGIPAPEIGGGVLMMFLGEVMAFVGALSIRNLYMQE